MLDELELDSIVINSYVKGNNKKIPLFRIAKYDPRRCVYTKIDYLKALRKALGFIKEKKENILSGEKFILGIKSYDKYKMLSIDDVIVLIENNIVIIKVKEKMVEDFHNECIHISRIDELIEKVDTMWKTCMEDYKHNTNGKRFKKVSYSVYGEKTLIIEVKPYIYKEFLEELIPALGRCFLSTGSVSFGDIHKYREFNLCELNEGEYVFKLSYNESSILAIEFPTESDTDKFLMEEMDHIC